MLKFNEILKIGMLIMLLSPVLVSAEEEKNETSETIPLNENFERGHTGWSIHKAKEEYKCEVTMDKHFEGKQSLYIETITSPPDTTYYLSIIKSGIPVEAGKEYVLSFYYQLSEVKENTKMYQKWQRRPSVPSLRIQFFDSSGKATTKSTKEYVWISGPFEENVSEWRCLRKIFKTPEKTVEIRITIFFNASGKYWIDNVRCSAF